MKKLLISFSIILICVIFLSVLVKGQIGNPVYYQNDYDTRVGGPYEASNSTSRYALVQSIVDNKSLTLTRKLASFASPDVVFSNGKFTSIFTPGVSFIGVPFYALGKLTGFPQLITYLSTIIFAIINLFLVRKIALRLGASSYASLISGFLFLFATDALAYALSFTQHHFSTTVILLGILNALEERTFITNAIFGGLYGVGILFDIPNAILMAPLLLFIFYKQFSVRIQQESKKLLLQVKVNVIWLAIGVLPFIGVLAFYNHQTAGSYTALAQFIGRTDVFDTKPVKKQPNTSGQKNLPFNTRPQLSGLYTLVVSDERSWLVYSPVVLIGIIGLILAYRRKETKIIASLCIAVALVDLILYSMFGDPWGGWSFGPRYLIPAAAIVCSGIGLAFDRFKKNLLFLIPFFTLAIYSLGISIVGALTTSSIPPKIEAIHLASPLPYTYQYNLELIAKNQSSSLFYNMFLAPFLNLNVFVIILLVVLTLILTTLYVFSASRKIKGVRTK